MGEHGHGCGRCGSTVAALEEAAQHPAAQMISFSFGRLLVNRWGLQRMARAVRTGRITLGASGSGNSYHPSTDTISFHRDSPAPHVAVHELIHALQDEARMPADIHLAEALAYLGETMYVLVRSRTDRAFADLLAKDAARKSMNQRANDLRYYQQQAIGRAEWVIDFFNLLSPGVHEVTPGMLSSIVQTLRRFTPPGRIEVDGVPHR